MLTQQFRYDNYRLHQLGNNSVFTLTLQAGLSAIKTPYPSSARWARAVILRPTSKRALHAPEVRPALHCVRRPC